MKYNRLIVSLALPQLAGIIGALFTGQAITNWYSTLEKPFFNPPNYLFGPVWVILYLFMGIAIYLIWQRIDEHHEVKEVLGIFWLHLILNALWSPIFFGLKSPGYAFIFITILWILILALTIKFWDIDKRASYLFIPYLFWVSFATILNYYILILN